MSITVATSDLSAGFDSFLKLVHRFRSYALSAIRVGYLDIVGTVVLMYPTVASVVKCALPLGYHSKHIIVHEEYYYGQLIKNPTPQVSFQSC